MKHEYDSHSRQLQVSFTKGNVKLDYVFTACLLTTASDGLTKLDEYIATLVQQCLPRFRADEMKIRFFRIAVLCYYWAPSPIRDMFSKLPAQIWARACDLRTAAILRRPNGPFLPQAELRGAAQCFPNGPHNGSLAALPCEKPPRPEDVRVVR